MIRYAATALLASLGFAAGVSGRAAERTGLEAAPTPRFADVTLATGVRLRYAEQGDRGGPAVILLHGYSDSWFSWSRVMPLIPARYHVIAPDQRGHGDSDKPEGGYAMRDMAADVLSLMDALHLERATVVGHSMGSFIAQQIAVAASGRVERLVLVGSAPAFRRMSGVDVFAAPAQQALIAQLPEARSSIYAETGHAPHWERPERFAGDLMRFVGAKR